MLCEADIKQFTALCGLDVSLINPATQIEQEVELKQSTVAG